MPIDPNEKVSVTLTRQQWQIITQAIWNGTVLPTGIGMPLINAIQPQLEGNTEVQNVRKTGNSKLLSPVQNDD